MRVIERLYIASDVAQFVLEFEIHISIPIRVAHKRRSGFAEHETQNMFCRIPILQVQSACTLMSFLASMHCEGPETCVLKYQLHSVGLQIWQSGFPRLLEAV